MKNTLLAIEILNKRLGVVIFKTHNQFDHIVCVCDFNDKDIKKFMIDDLVKNNLMTDSLKGIVREILKDQGIGFIRIESSCIILAPISKGHKMNDLERIVSIKNKVNSRKSDAIVYHPETDLVQLVKDYFRFVKPNCLISELSEKDIKRALLANSLTSDFF